MTLSADHDMVVQGDGDGSEGVGHLPCHIDIRRGRRGVAGGVVVHNLKVIP